MISLSLPPKFATPSLQNTPWSQLSSATLAIAHMDGQSNRQALSIG